MRTLVLAEPPVITLFVSNAPKPLEMLKLLITRPRTAAAIIKFGAKGVTPATKAFRQGDLEAGIRTFGDAVFGPGGYDRLSKPRRAQVHDNLTNVKAELLGSGFAKLDARQVHGVQAPTLLVTGQQSIGLFHRLTARLEELLPHAERVEIPGADIPLEGVTAYLSQSDTHQILFMEFEKDVDLDKYTIVEPGRTRTVYNWLQYFALEELKSDFVEGGFSVDGIYSNVAGTPYDRKSSEFAVTAKRAQTGTGSIFIADANKPAQHTAHRLRF